jgi:hypothetical protein
MDLIDRYLDAVKLLLPVDEREDILAELRDVLLTRREEQAAALGRPLTRAEDEQLLKAYGHPLAVAARYGRQQALIGADLYPAYLLVLKVVGAAIAFSAVLTGVVLVLVSPNDLHRAIATAVEIAWSGGFASVGAVTVVFAILQRSGAVERMQRDWKVDELPRFAHPRRREPGWPTFVAGLVVQALFLLWWTGVLPVWWAHIPVKPHGMLTLGLAPVWRDLYLPVIGLSMAAIGVEGAKLGGVRGRLGRGLDLALNVGVAVLAGVALSAGHWAEVSGAGIPPAALAKAALGVNIGAKVALIVVTITALTTAAVHAWRLWRPAAEPKRALNGA